MAKMMKMSMKKKSAMKSGMKKMSMKKMSMKKTGMKRKMNEFFKLQMAAKAKNAPTFVYNGNTYKRKTKGHLVFYKK